MTRPIVIALDGPAGVGKSTVGERVGRELGYFYFDTGVLYRAVALRAIEMGTSLDDEAALGRLTRELDVTVRPPSRQDGRQCDVLIDGRDVSQAIRTPEVDAVVSIVAASPAVRGGLIDLQRRQVQGAGSILAGRDIGTVVCPDANLKVFLVASSRERARRRVAQRGGKPASLEREQQAIEQRDQLDSTRSLAPLVRAEDAVEIDTEGKSVEEVVEAVIDALEHALGRPAERVGRDAKRNGG
ncbi:MAG: (d)CMP kinase [Chloroflexota bacterium]|nr:(d)CMP kinase [Chloroflexota bacterium]